MSQKLTLSIKASTTTFLTHLGFTALAAGSFAGLDYIANHGTINSQQLLIFVSGAVIVALLHAFQTFYQAQGDATASDAFAQLSAAIQALEQRLMQVQRQIVPQSPANMPGPPKLDAGPSLPPTWNPPPPSSIAPPAPIAPRFSLPAALDRPAYHPEFVPPPPQKGTSPDSSPLFTLTGQDMDERLSQFPFRPQE